METKKFIMLPYVLFSSERYASLPADAKLLYALLLDRQSLSERNGWKDENGCVFLCFSIAEICAAIGCGHNKAVRLMRALETARLLRRDKLGQGKTDRLYVLPLEETVPKTESKTSQNGNSRVPEKGILEFPKAERNYTKENKTEVNNTYTSCAEAEEACKTQIEFDTLAAEETYRDYLDVIVSVMTETEVGLSSTVRVGQTDYPRAFVRERFRQLDAGCVQEVIEEVLHTDQRILHIKPYLLTALFHAPQAVQAKPPQISGMTTGGIAN